MSNEDRVIAALNALAEGTPVPPNGEARLVGRLRREHRLRRGGALLGSIAMVVGVAAVAGTLGSSGGSAGPAPLPFASAASTPDPAPSSMASDLARLRAEKDAAASSPSPSPAPTYPPPAADVGGPRWFLALEASGSWAFHDARTGESSASAHPTGYTVTAVAAGGDKRVYYTAATKGTCGTVHFNRVEITSINYTGDHDVPGTAGVRGQVISMAVSRDGSQLAYSIATKVDPNYPKECSGYEVRVLNLRTGTTRRWTGGDSTPGDLNWAPDNRMLLLHVSACCGDYEPEVDRLDTRAAGTSFENAPAVPGTTVTYAKTSDECPDGLGITETASSRTEVFGVQECFSAPSSARVVVLDPVSGRVLRKIGTIVGADITWSLSVSPDGHHVLMSAAADPQGNYRIDDGVVSQLPTHLDRLVW